MTERLDPPYAADERTLLLGFLDYHRATLALKTEALSADQLRQTLPPSGMTLGGLLKHLALVEVTWLCRRFAGGVEGAPWEDVDWAADADWEWHSAAHDSPEALFALWSDCVARARAAYDGAELDDLARTPMRSGDHPSLRWILLHLIEEYARHNGHADLIRESIDGTVGE